MEEALSPPSDTPLPTPPPKGLPAPLLTGGIWWVLRDSEAGRGEGGALSPIFWESRYRRSSLSRETSSAYFNTSSKWVAMNSCMWVVRCNLCILALHPNLAKLQGIGAYEQSLASWLSIEAGRIRRPQYRHGTATPPEAAAIRPLLWEMPLAGGRWKPEMGGTLGGAGEGPSPKACRGVNMPGPNLTGDLSWPEIPWAVADRFWASSSIVSEPPGRVIAGTL